MLLGAPARFAIDRAGGPGIAVCCRLSAAAAFTASAHAAAHSRGCTNRTAAAFSRSCTSQSRALACRESANRTTFPDTAAPLADVRGRGLIATVEAALAPHIHRTRLHRLAPPRPPSPRLHQPPRGRLQPQLHLSEQSPRVPRKREPHHLP